MELDLGKLLAEFLRKNRNGMAHRKYARLVGLPHSRAYRLEFRLLEAKVSDLSTIAFHLKIPVEIILGLHMTWRTEPHLFGQPA